MASTRVADNIGQNRGKTVVGCFPLYPPLEVFASMGLHPVVLWNLKDSVLQLDISDKHIQQYACGIARELAQFVMSGTGDLLDAIFSYNACDTLRNLPEILAVSNTKAGRNIPMLRMHLPQVDRAQCNPDEYLKKEIVDLIKNIEDSFGKQFSPEAFFQITKKYSKMRRLCIETEDLVAQGAILFEDFCHVVLSGYSISIEKHIADLEKLIDTSKTHGRPAETKIIISGIMPPPLPVIKAMEDLNMRVVANDIASLRRSYAYSPEPTDNPVDYYSDFYANRFPCTTLLYKSDARIKAILDMAHKSHADGLIFCGEKFCEHEYFEFPYLKKQLNDMGVSTLFLEFSVDDVSHVESHITRVEAFSETLESNQRGKL